MYLNLAYIFIGFVWCIHACSVSRLCLTLLTPWTVARQAPLFMSFSRQEYQSGLPFPSPGELSDPGTEPPSPVPPASADGFFTDESPGRPRFCLVQFSSVA